MDHADSQLAGRTQPFQHSLAGTDAGHGESSIMTTPSFYTDGQGKGHLPLQPHPKNKTKAVYTEELTHLATIRPSDEKQVSTKPPPPLAGVSEIACLCFTFSCSRMTIIKASASYFACVSPATTAASLSSIWFQPSN